MASRRELCVWFFNIAICSRFYRKQFPLTYTDQNIPQPYGLIDKRASKHLHTRMGG
jgi:hypothetical protein